MKSPANNISDGRLAAKGAILTTAAIFIYSLIVLLYVVLRTSFEIANKLPVGERSSIIFANAVALTYTIAVFSLLMVLVFSITGAIGALVIKRLVFRFNPQFNVRKTLLFSGMVGLVLLVLVYVVLRLLLQKWMTLQYPETLLFWFVFPATICFIFYLISGMAFNRFLLTHYRVLEK